MTKKASGSAHEGRDAPAGPPPPPCPFPEPEPEGEGEADDDPFVAAAQRELSEDAFLKERVDRALHGVRNLLPPGAVSMAEEMFVELFTQDPVVRRYVDRLRPRVAPAATDDQREVRPGAVAEAAAAAPLPVPALRKLAGGSGS